MLRLLRIAEGEPPVIFRFTETPADKPREVLERAQVAVRKAMRGEIVEGGVSTRGGGGGEAGSNGGTDGKGRGKTKGKGGKEGG